MKLWSRKPITLSSGYALNCLQTQYHKILDWSKLKDLADDISKWAFIEKWISQGVEYILEK